jgi:mRNA interferase RelE/StbE
MYEVVLEKKAEKEFLSLDKEAQKIVAKKLLELKNGNFFNDKALKGKYKGKFRKRAGDYRIIYLKENNTIAIIVIECSEKLLNFTQASCNFCQRHRLKILLKSANASAPSGLSALFSPNGEHKIFKLKLQSFRSIYNFPEVSIKISHRKEVY